MGGLKEDILSSRNGGGGIKDPANIQQFRLTAPAATLWSAVFEFVP